MIPLAALAAGAAVVPQLIKGFSGILMSAKGRRLERENKRPTFNIPGEFRENVARAEMMAREGMPSAQYNQASNNIRRNMAGGFLAASRGRGRQNIASMIRAGNDGFMDLDAQNANMRLGNERFAFGQRQNMGQMKLQKQQWDKLDLYNEMDQKAQGNIGAGRQNTMGALDGLSSVAISAMGGGMFGGGGGGNTASMPEGFMGGNESVGMFGTRMNPNATPGMYGTRLNPVGAGRYGTRLNYNR